MSNYSDDGGKASARKKPQPGSKMSGVISPQKNQESTSAA